MALNELYKSLSPVAREVLSQYEEQMTVPAGTALICQGAMPEHLIVIEQGSVQISVPAGGKTMVLGEAGEGKILGLRSVLTGALSEVEVTTLEECRIVRIHERHFRVALQQHPEMYFAISKVLSSDLNVAERFLRHAPRAANREKRVSDGLR
jgi:CRP-like cAMP-binding protein